jgi:hypothetical protein
MNKLLLGSYRLMQPPMCVLWLLLVLNPASAEPTAATAAAANGPAAAAEPSPEQAAGGPDQLKLIRKFCEPDAKRFCKSVIPGGGRLLHCLREHESELASDCRKVLEHSSANR